MRLLHFVRNDILSVDVLMFDALRERTLKGTATKSFNSGLNTHAEMAMNF
jgi:hypothetical protein